MVLLAGLTLALLEAKSVVAFSPGSGEAAGCLDSGYLVTDTAETNEGKHREATLPASRPEVYRVIPPGGPNDQGQTCRLCQNLPCRCHRGPIPGSTAPPAQGRRLESRGPRDR